MIHRPSDSRLLNNLINNEKDYTKHLNALSPISHSALASLSAFAVAYSSVPSSGTTLSQTVSKVVDIFANADGALSRYAQAVESWREELVALKELEEDVGAVLRDRDILVTRLIKASKSHPHTQRQSAALSFHTGSTSPSNSIVSFPSTSSHSNLTSSSNAVPKSSKMGVAQSELQACEEHLLLKEKELEDRRIRVVRNGLGGRCRALLECGWVWSEMGKEGIRVAESAAIRVDTPVSNGHAQPAPPSSASEQQLQDKPLPHPLLTVPSDKARSHNLSSVSQPSSDISSVTPSQSASQNHAAVQIPDFDRAYASGSRTSNDGVNGNAYGRDGMLNGAYHSVHKQSAAADDEDSDERDSNRGEVTLSIPPAHSISDITLPLGTIDNISGKDNQDANRSRTLRRPISRRVSRVSERSEEDYTTEARRNSLTFPSMADSSHRRSRLENADDRSEPETNSSSEFDDQVPLEIVVNKPFERFQTGGRRSTLAQDRAGKQDFAAQAEGVRERKTSTGIFGSIRGLFKSSHSQQSHDSDWDAEGSETPSRSHWFGKGHSPVKSRFSVLSSASVGATRHASEDERQGSVSKGTGKWSTRTDANLKAATRRGGTGSDSDSEIRAPRYMDQAAGSALTSLEPKGRKERERTNQEDKGKLKKKVGAGKAKEFPSQKGAPKGSISVDGAEPARGRNEAKEGGWIGDTSTRPRRSLSRRKSASRTTDLNNKADGATFHSNDEVGARTLHTPKRDTAPSRLGTLSSSEIPSLSRNSSLSKGSIQERQKAKRMSVSAGGEGDIALDEQSKPPRRAASISYTPVARPGVSSQHNQTQSDRRTPSRSTTTISRDRLPNGDANMVGSTSLMSIVEDVTKQNRQGWAARDSLSALASYNSNPTPPPSSVKRQPTRSGASSAEDGDAHRNDRADSKGSRVDRAPTSRRPSTSTMEVPQAPGPVTRPTSEILLLSRSHSQSHSLTQSSSMVPSSSSNQTITQGTPRPSLRPAKSPLRSALRQSSRTPSPSPARLEEIGVIGMNREGVKTSAEKPRGSTPEREDKAMQKPPSVPAQPNTKVPSTEDGDAQVSDSASISSYETGHEILFEQANEPPTPSPPPPPPHDYEKESNLSSLTSTESPPVVRRKSVRVSLQPTFSPTPPAFDDDAHEGDSGGGRYPPWDSDSPSGWHSRRNSTTQDGHQPIEKDFWEDSSEEDDDYRRAKKLLMRVAKKSQSKGKVRN